MPGGVGLVRVLVRGGVDARVILDQCRAVFLAVLDYSGPNGALRMTVEVPGWPAALGAGLRYVR